MKIAVIGAGIAGLGCAWALSKKHEVTLFEKNDRLGGHSRTIDAHAADNVVPVDTGFIVFNKPNYPNLVALFDILGVSYTKSRMSFGVSQRNGAFEYGTGGASSFFGQVQNLVRPSFWRMFFDILKFNKNAKTSLRPNMSLGELLSAMKLSDNFRDQYLLPMASSIWSTPNTKMLDYPAETFLNFFDNHGLLTLFNQPQWYTVKGGSREYVNKMEQAFAGDIQLSAEISTVRRDNGKIIVDLHTGLSKEFDKVVFACHADQTVDLIGDIDDAEKQVLENFKFSTNQVVTHLDHSLMPKRRRCWSSWVHLDSGNDSDLVSLSYWMNNLQPLDTDTDIFVTLNSAKAPDAGKVEDEWVAEHPLFDRNAIDAQSDLKDIQGRNHTYFCGAWTGYGFHEDGLRSGIDVAEMIGATIPWRAQT